jgi:starch-binding outer membrane protein, SusD/RagB family
MKNKFLITVATLAALSFSACITEVDDVPELNSPTQEAVTKNATITQIQQLGAGVQAVMRNGYWDMSSCAGSIGREIVMFNRTDNRYYTELQGQVAIDPGGIFYPWYLSYTSTRRRAEIFSLSAANSSALTPAQKKACEGFAKTVQAYVTLNLLNMMGEVGIRTTFSDLLAPGDLLDVGPFVSYADGLAFCKSLTDQGLAALDAAGTTAFPFPTAAGWAGFNTPATFKRFNRAMAARVAMYQKDWAGMNTALAASFLDINGALTLGPKFNYSTTAGDASLGGNFFRAKDDANFAVMAQNSFVPDAEAGDTRVFGASRQDGGTAKVRRRAATASLGGFAESFFEMQLVATQTTSLDIIRNEELILMSAEAKAQTNDLPGALAAVNKIRTAHGLAASTASTQAALIDEILKQRRYSLFMEGGHRWFDMRRYNRLATLPKDLPTHNVLANFPKPQNEVDWDNRPR